MKKLKSYTIEELRTRMESSPQVNARWYQDCERELARRASLPPAPAPRVIKHHTHAPVVEALVTVREPDVQQARTHNNKQKQSSLSLSPRKRVSAWTGRYAD